MDNNVIKPAELFSTVDRLLAQAVFPQVRGDDVMKIAQVINAFRAITEQIAAGEIVVAKAPETEVSP